ncbi:MAG: hypothetical protein JSU90_01835 [Nitrospiraceae bacterium]|nr:MAG: hypothetical protein JSU90_01835 [Nitrospiraceae bacterium]
MGSISRKYLVQSDVTSSRIKNRGSGTLYALVHGTNTDLNPLLSVAEKKFDRLYVIYSRERQA